MNMYNGYNYGGMHFIWWIIWFAFIIWIFFTPYYIPGRRRNLDTPLDLLKKRLAAGEISENEFLQIKKTLESS